MNFSGKTWLMIILKIRKKQGFILSLSLENTYLGKPQGEGVKFNPQLFKG